MDVATLFAPGLPAQTDAAPAAFARPASGGSAFGSVLEAAVAAPGGQTQAESRVGRGDGGASPVPGIPMSDDVQMTDPAFVMLEGPHPLVVPPALFESVPPAGVPATPVVAPLAADADPAALNPSPEDPAATGAGPANPAVPGLPTPVDRLIGFRTRAAGTRRADAGVAGPHPPAEPLPAWQPSTNRAGRIPDDESGVPAASGHATPLVSDNAMTASGAGWAAPSDPVPEPSAPADAQTVPPEATCGSSIPVAAPPADLAATVQRPDVPSPATQAAQPAATQPPAARPAPTRSLAWVADVPASAAGSTPVDSEIPGGFEPPAQEPDTAAGVDRPTQAAWMAPDAGGARARRNQAGTPTVQTGADQLAAAWRGRNVSHPVSPEQQAGTAQTGAQMAQVAEQALDESLPGTRDNRLQAFREGRAFRAYQRAADQPGEWMPPVSRGEHTGTGAGAHTATGQDGRQEARAATTSGSVFAPSFEHVATMPASTTPTATTREPIQSETPTASQPTVDGEPLAKSIVRSLQVQWKQNGGEARLKLHPEFLGDLSVSLKIQGASVTAVLVAESPAVREWIDNHQHELRRALEDAGLSLDSLSVDADGHADQQREQSSQEQRRQNPSRRPVEEGRFEALL